MCRMDVFYSSYINIRMYRGHQVCGSSMSKSGIARVEAILADMRQYNWSRDVQEEGCRILSEISDIVRGEPTGKTWISEATLL